jgi:hypothetical protein
MQTQRERGSYARGEVVRLYGSFKTNGTSAPDTLRDGHSFLIKSVARQSAGLYLITLEPETTVPELLIEEHVSIQAIGSQVVLCKARFVAGSWNATNRTFQIKVVTGTPVPAVTTGQAVTANAATLTKPGPIIAVQATTGTVTGACTIACSGAPLTKQCTVTYDASGIPTLTFLAGDAVTACSYVQMTQGVVDPDTATRINFELVGSVNSAGTDLA